MSSKNLTSSASSVHKNVEGNAPTQPVAEVNVQVVNPVSPASIQSSEILVTPTQGSVASKVLDSKKKDDLKKKVDESEEVVSADDQEPEDQVQASEESSAPEAAESVAYASEEGGEGSGDSLELSADEVGKLADLQDVASSIDASSSSMLSAFSNNPLMFAQAAGGTAAAGSAGGAAAAGAAAAGISTTAIVAGVAVVGVAAAAGGGSSSGGVTPTPTPEPDPDQDPTVQLPTAPSASQTLDATAVTTTSATQVQQLSGDSAPTTALASSDAPATSAATPLSSGTDTFSAATTVTMASADNSPAGIIQFADYTGSTGSDFATATWASFGNNDTADFGAGKDMIAFTAVGTQAAVGTVANVEYLRFTATATADIDTSKFTGAEELWNYASTSDVTFSNVASSDIAIGLYNTAADTTVSMGTNSLAGTDPTVDVFLLGATGGDLSFDAEAGATLGATDFDIQLSSNGSSANRIGTLSDSSSDLFENIVLVGSQALTIDKLDVMTKLDSFDASGFAGNLTVTTASLDDGYNTSGTSFIGGLGTNTLSGNIDADASNVSFIRWDTLNLKFTADAEVDLDGSLGVKKIVLSDDGAAAAASFENIGVGTTFATSDYTAGGAQSFKYRDLSDFSLSVTKGSTAAAVSFGAVTLENVRNTTISSSNTSTTAVTSLALGDTARGLTLSNTASGAMTVGAVTHSNETGSLVASLSTTGTGGLTVDSLSSSTESVFATVNAAGGTATATGGMITLTSGVTSSEGDVLLSVTATSADVVVGNTVSGKGAVDVRATANADTDETRGSTTGGHDVTIGNVTSSDGDIVVNLTAGASAKVGGDADVQIGSLTSDKGNVSVTVTSGGGQTIGSDVTVGAINADLDMSLTISSAAGSYVSVGAMTSAGDDGNATVNITNNSTTSVASTLDMSDVSAAGDITLVATNGAGGYLDIGTLDTSAGDLVVDLTTAAGSSSRASTVNVGVLRADGEFGKIDLDIVAAKASTVDVAGALVAGDQIAIDVAATAGSTVIVDGGITSAAGNIIVDLAGTSTGNDKTTVTFGVVTATKGTVSIDGTVTGDSADITFGTLTATEGQVIAALDVSGSAGKYGTIAINQVDGVKGVDLTLESGISSDVDLGAVNATDGAIRLVADAGTTSSVTVAAVTAKSGAYVELGADKSSTYTVTSVGSTGEGATSVVVASAAQNAVTVDIGAVSSVTGDAAVAITVGDTADLELTSLKATTSGSVTLAVTAGNSVALTGDANAATNMDITATGSGKSVLVDLSAGTRFTASLEDVTAAGAITFDIDTGTTADIDVATVNSSAGAVLIDVVAGSTSNVNIATTVEGSTSVTVNTEAGKGSTVSVGSTSITADGDTGSVVLDLAATGTSVTHTIGDVTAASSITASYLGLGTSNVTIGKLTSTNGAVTVDLEAGATSNLTFGTVSAIGDDGSLTVTVDATSGAANVNAQMYQVTTLGDVSLTYVMGSSADITLAESITSNEGSVVIEVTGGQATKVQTGSAAHIVAATAIEVTAAVTKSSEVEFKNLTTNEDAATIDFTVTSGGAASVTASAGAISADGDITVSVEVGTTGDIDFTSLTSTNGLVESLVTAGKSTVATMGSVSAVGDNGAVAVELVAVDADAVTYTHTTIDSAGAVEITAEAGKSLDMDVGAVTSADSSVAFSITAGDSSSFAGGGAVSAATGISLDATLGKISSVSFTTNTLTATGDASTIALGVVATGLERITFGVGALSADGDVTLEFDAGKSADVDLGTVTSANGSFLATVTGGESSNVLIGNVSVSGTESTVNVALTLDDNSDTDIGSLTSSTTVDVVMDGADGVGSKSVTYDIAAISGEGAVGVTLNAGDSADIDLTTIASTDSSVSVAATLGSGTLNLTSITAGTNAVLSAEVAKFGDVAVSGAITATGTINVSMNSGDAVENSVTFDLNNLVTDGAINATFVAGDTADINVGAVTSADGAVGIVATLGSGTLDVTSITAGQTATVTVTADDYSDVTVSSVLGGTSGAGGISISATSATGAPAPKGATYDLGSLTSDNAIGVTLVAGDTADINVGAASSANSSIALTATLGSGTLDVTSLTAGQTATVTVTADDYSDVTIGNVIGGSSGTGGIVLTGTGTGAKGVTYALSDLTSDNSIAVTLTAGDTADINVGTVSSANSSVLLSATLGSGTLDVTSLTAGQTATVTVTADDYSDVTVGNVVGGSSGTGGIVLTGTATGAKGVTYALSDLTSDNAIGVTLTAGDTADINFGAVSSANSTVLLSATLGSGTLDGTTVTAGQTATVTVVADDLTDVNFTGAIEGGASGTGGVIVSMTGGGNGATYGLNGLTSADALLATFVAGDTADINLGAVSSANELVNISATLGSGTLDAGTVTAGTTASITVNADDYTDVTVANIVGGNGGSGGVTISMTDGGKGVTYDFAAITGADAVLLTLAAGDTADINATSITSTNSSVTLGLTMGSGLLDIDGVTAGTSVSLDVDAGVRFDSDIEAITATTTVTINMDGDRNRVTYDIASVTTDGNVTATFVAGDTADINLGRVTSTAGAVDITLDVGRSGDADLAGITAASVDLDFDVGSTTTITLAGIETSGAGTNVVADLDGAGNVSIDGITTSGGTVSINAGGLSGNFTFVGSSLDAAATIVGATGLNNIETGSGDDVISFTEGSDILAVTGGGGNDTITFTTTTSYDSDLHGTVHDVETINLANGGPNTFTAALSLQDNTDYVTLNGGDGVDTVTLTGHSAVVDLGDGADALVLRDADTSDYTLMFSLGDTGVTGSNASATNFDSVSGFCFDLGEVDSSVDFAFWSATTMTGGTLDTDGQVLSFSTATSVADQFEAVASQVVSDAPGTALEFVWWTRAGDAGERDLYLFIGDSVAGASVDDVFVKFDNVDDALGTATLASGAIKWA